MIYSFMKRRILFLWTILLFSFPGFINAQAVLKFSDSRKNFGFVKQGKVVEMKYELTNKGNQPLIISDYKVECSCTTVSFPKDPVLPNQKAIITVSFDTKTVFDRQDRVVEIYSNSLPDPYKLRFKGVVLKK